MAIHGKIAGLPRKIVLMLQKSGVHQLRLVVEIPIVYDVFFVHPKGG